MINYKLIIILVLSVIIYFLFNKIQTLNNEIKILKKNTSKSTKENKYLDKFYNSEESSEKLDINLQIKTPQNKVFVNNISEDTNNFNATESTKYTDEKIVTYSNESKNESSLTVEELKKSIDEQYDDIKLQVDELKKSIEEEEEQNVELKKNLDEKINNLNLENNNTNHENICNLNNECKIDEVKEEDNKLLDEVSEKTVDNKNKLLDKVSEKTVEHEDLIASYSSEENNNLEILKKSNEIKNIKNIINKDKINQYKLKQLQDFANKVNIDITKEKNGKIKNKTKNELWTDLSNI